MRRLGVKALSYKGPQDFAVELGDPPPQRPRRTHERRASEQKRDSNEPWVEPKTDPELTEDEILFWSSENAKPKQ